MEEYGLSALFITAVPVIAILMEALRSWLDAEDKLKPYRMYIAIAASLLVSALFVFVAGWDLASFALRAAVIYSGQHVFQQAWFKKIWPVAKKIFEIVGKKWNVK